MGRGGGGGSVIWEEGEGRDLCFSFCFLSRREYYFSDENLQKDFFLRRQVRWEGGGGGGGA